MKVWLVLQDNGSDILGVYEDEASAQAVMRQAHRWYPNSPVHVEEWDVTPSIPCQTITRADLFS